MFPGWLKSESSPRCDGSVTKSGTTAKYEERLAQARADLSHINAGLNSLADIIIMPGDLRYGSILL
jgi:hypothetical protein